MGSAQGKGDEKSDDPNLTDKQLADEVEEEEKKDDVLFFLSVANLCPLPQI